MQSKHAGGIVPTVYALAIAAAAVLLTLPVFTIVDFAFLHAALDASWSAALVEQAARGASFGRDVIFTGGPLSILYTRYFHPALAPWAVSFSILILGLFAWCVFEIARRTQPRWLALALLAPMLLAEQRNDSFMFLVPVIFLVARLTGPMPRWPLASLVFCAASAALVAAKFSVAPIALVTAVLLDIDAVRRRGWFIHVIGLVAALFAIYVATGSAAGDFLLYLRGSLDTSLFYADAMGIRGNLLHLGLFVAGGIGLGAFLAGLGLRALLRGERKLETILLVLGLGLLLFVSFKAGFVRHPGHEVIAWHDLAWVGVLSMLALLPAVGGWRLAVRVAVGATAVAVAATGMTLFAVDRGLPVRGPWVQVASGLDAAQRTAAAVSDPGGWWDGLVESRRQAFETVRSGVPLPDFGGSVDVIASRQADLIGNGSDFAFRPTVQEYTTYSPLTRAANRAFFEGPSAPANLLLAPGSIDTRYPTTAEGSLWPLFFERYEPWEIVADQLWMKRRAEALPALLGEPQDVTVRLGEVAQVPVDGPSFVQIRMKPTWFRSVASILFRAPELRMTVTLSDGRTLTSRLIPELGQGGFLLSPHVATVADLAHLVRSPADRARLPRVTGISVDTGMLGRFAYADDVSLVFRSFDIPFAKRPLRFQATLLDRADQEGLLRPPFVLPIAEGLLAHAPASLDIPVSGKAISVGFGILPGAYDQGQSANGVCFSVRAGAGGDVLYSRCLEPQRVAGDRGRQDARIALPEGTDRIVLETDCRDICDYDWSYWAYLREEGL